MSSPVASAVPHEEVARRAYTIWEKKGRPERSEQEHWYDAERELMQTGVPSVAAEIANDSASGLAKSKIKTSRR